MNTNCIASGSARSHGDCICRAEPGQEMGSSGLRIVAVSASKVFHAKLRQIMRQFQWELECAYSVAEAIRVMRSTPAPVIICDCDLPDATWRDVLEESARQQPPSYLIVTSQLAHDAHLWSEVLNIGGDEVLAMPFEPAEVFASVSTGWRHRTPLVGPRAYAPAVT